MFKKILYSLIDYSLFLLSISVGFLFVAYPAYLAALILGKDGRAAFQRVTKYVFRIIFFLSPSIKKITILGRENLLKHKNFVITPTHRSFLDYLLVESLLHNIALFTNKPLTRLLIYRHISNLLGAHVVDNNSPAAYFKLFSDFKKCLNSGANVLIFPEGSRNTDDRLLQFKDGAFKLSMATNIPVLPIVMLGGDKIYKKGSMLRVSNVAHNITIIILEPLVANENETQREFCERTRHILQVAQDDFLGIHKSSIS